ncbi:hypothetical protein GCM10023094_07900 [Rhodococcus olei]|uniref:Uncharacterized protein n=1 Tax=Rhodococcus olei TaxID=2161675 RepID=A0ABP8NXA4_9NOCA
MFGPTSSRCRPDTTGLTQKPTNPSALPPTHASTATHHVTSKFRLLRGLPFRFSLGDHGPQHYIAALTPRGIANEFGDAPLIPGT